MGELKFSSWQETRFVLILNLTMIASIALASNIFLRWERRSRYNCKITIASLSFVPPSPTFYVKAHTHANACSRLLILLQHASTSSEGI